MVGRGGGWLQTPQAIFRLIRRRVRSWRRLLRTTIKAAFNTVSLFLSPRQTQISAPPVPSAISSAASPRASGTAERSGGDKRGRGGRTHGRCQNEESASNTGMFASAAPWVFHED